MATSQPTKQPLLGLNAFLRSKTFLLIHGLAGTGKSGIAASVLYNPHLKVVYILTEPNAITGLSDFINRANIRLTKGQLTIVDASKRSASFINTGLSALKDSQKNPSNEPLIRFNKAMVELNGKDAVTGEAVNLGSAASLPSGTVLIIDSMTYLAKAMLDMQNENTEWGNYREGQSLLASTLLLLQGLPAHVIVIFHSKDISKPEAKNSILAPCFVGTKSINEELGKFTCTLYTAYNSLDNSFKVIARKHGIVQSVRGIGDLTNTTYSLDNLPLGLTHPIYSAFGFREGLDTNLKTTG